MKIDNGNNNKMITTIKFTAQQLHYYMPMMTTEQCNATKISNITS